MLIYVYENDQKSRSNSKREREQVGTVNVTDFDAPCSWDLGYGLKILCLLFVLRFGRTFFKVFL